MSELVGDVGHVARGDTHTDHTHIHVHRKGTELGAIFGLNQTYFGVVWGIDTDSLLGIVHPPFPCLLAIIHWFTRMMLLDSGRVWILP